MAYDKIETQLVLLGTTGVEDKLQEGVPKTICALREAGIKVLQICPQIYFRRKCVHYVSIVI